jgi:hypothetical protein
LQPLPSFRSVADRSSGPTAASRLGDDVGDAEARGCWQAVWGVAFTGEQWPMAA